MSCDAADRRILAQHCVGPLLELDRQLQLLPIDFHAKRKHCVGRHSAPECWPTPVDDRVDTRVHSPGLRICDGHQSSCCRLSMLPMPMTPAPPPPTRPARKGGQHTSSGMRGKYLHDLAVATAALLPPLSFTWRSKW